MNVNTAINEMENRKTRERINKTKSSFFEKNSKNEKPLASPGKKKEKQNN